MSGVTPRYGFHYPTGTDATNVPGDLQETFDEIDAIVVTAYTGSLAARPAPAVFGRQYYTSDTQELFFDTGSAWIGWGPINVSAGNISTSLPGATAGAGAVGLSADAGHTHAREGRAVITDLQPTGPVAALGGSGHWVDAAHVHPGDCIGDIKHSVTGIASVGWMIANGAAVSRTTYATFYNAAGGVSAYPWGQGDGSTTFNLPNLMDVAIVGAGNLYTLGEKFGSATTTLSVAQLPPHNHNVEDPGHSHSLSTDGGGQFVVTWNEPPYTFGSGGQQVTYTYGSVVANYAGISLEGAYTGITSTEYTGSALPVSLSQPSAALIPLVKVL